MRDQTIAAVGDLWNRGLSIIPVEFRGKHPACPWKQFQSRRATYSEIEGWFGKAASLLALALIGEGDFLNSPLAFYTPDEN